MNTAGRKPRKRNPRHRESMKWFGLLLLALLMAVLAWPARAQQLPEVPSEFLNRARQLGGDSVRFCINNESVLAGWDEAVAHLLADALLIEAKLEFITPPEATPELDFRLPVDQNTLFMLMTNDCDAFMGFTLAPDQLPDWLSITRPYLQTRHVALTANRDIADLSELTADDSVSTRLMSQVDLVFVNHLQSGGKSAAVRRVPYPDNRLALERLADGSVDGALVWEPAACLYATSKAGAADFRVITSRGLRVDPVSFGLVLNADDAHLQYLLDDAIAYLSAEGMFAELWETQPDLATPLSGAGDTCRYLPD